MRKLSKLEEHRLEILTNYSPDIALLEPTGTALEKSIIDATKPVRAYLKIKKIHDYETQGLGQEEHGIFIPTSLISGSSIKKTKSSLYRPKTKKGDPRIWVYGLKSFVKPNDIIGLWTLDKTLHIVNITRLPIEELAEADRISPLKLFLTELEKQEGSAADELLSKLQAIADRGLVKAICAGDTSIGRTLEALLNIRMNSNKTPDYKGIEIKSYRRRGGRGNRKNLFAKVPNWEISKFKSSQEILDNFGYTRSGRLQLYCTVSAIKRNSQGLTLKLDYDKGLLHENSNKGSIGNFATWILEELHQELIDKHNETFWVAAKSVRKSDSEYFQFEKVLHTRKPIITQFDLLLGKGVVTMDHLNRAGRTGRAKERGPLFKITQSGIDLLFPPSKEYILRSD